MSLILSSTAVPEVDDNTISNSTQLANADVAVGDFVVVDFNMTEQRNTVRRFLGRILKVKSATIDVKFLTQKNTKVDSGLIYTFPKIDDIVENIKIEDIYRKLSPPIELRRGGFKFDVTSKEW